MTAVRAALLLLAATLAGAASAAPPAALSALEPGLWQLKTVGEPVRDICVADPVALVQLRHGAGACSQLVVEDARSRATVQYSCPGAGWGRTSVRVAGPRAANIDTQGIADNAPFAFTAEARRVGDCPARTAAIAR